MSTSALLPVSAVTPVDYDSSSATSPQQTVFNSILAQLQQTVSNGDLTSSQTLLNTVNAISPSASTGSTPLASFLTSLNSALSSGSITAAQAALETYQSAVPAVGSGASAPPPIPLIPTANPNAVAAQIAASLVQSEDQLLLVNALDNPNSTLGAASSSSTSNLIGILNAAYPASTAASTQTSSTASSTPSSDPTTAASSPSTTPSSTPYDALVSSIQASLAAGNGTLTPALAYLQAAGNFVNTTA